MSFSSAPQRRASPSMGMEAGRAAKPSAMVNAAIDR
jgi:hypothetical protein